MHVLPRVREIEERFGDMLTVIGVHAGKFVTERITERIAEACDRLDVPHAIVNDRQYRIWRDYAVSAWPTIAVIDPEGYLTSVTAGEVSVEALAMHVQEVAEHAQARGTLVRGPDPTRPALSRHEGPLRFPTRAVLHDRTLWIADTGHGRVLECRWDDSASAATVLDEHRGFTEPRGMAVLADDLYVADRVGHAIYRLRAGRLPERVAGTGAIAEMRVREGHGLRTSLRSPWGLEVEGGRLLITMAGSHQLWEYRPSDGSLRHLAGTGYEEILDGPPDRSALAQPTGLCSASPGIVAFSDCESSAVRAFGEDMVHTLVGRDLFKFGDRDGVGDEALLQHNEDVTLHRGVLAVADTYNDRLKRIDPSTRECSAWRGEAGEPGTLREPGGVASSGEVLLVADTGHHRIVRVHDDGSIAEVSLV